MKKSPSTVTRQDIWDIFTFYCIEMICSSFDVKVIFTTPTFRIWGLNKVQKGVWGKMLQRDGAYSYTVTVYPVISYGALFNARPSIEKH